MADENGTQGLNWDSWENLTKDRNFLSLLAGMGSKFGAGGVGEMIGTPTLQNIQSVATQEALAKGEAERGKWNQAWLDLLRGAKYSDPTMPGPNKLTIGPKSTVLEVSNAKSMPKTGDGTGANAEKVSGNASGATTIIGTPDNGIQRVGDEVGGTYTEIPYGGGMKSPKLDLLDSLGFWQTQSR